MAFKIASKLVDYLNGHSGEVVELEVLTTSDRTVIRGVLGGVGPQNLELLGEGDFPYRGWFQGIRTIATDKKVIYLDRDIPTQDNPDFYGRQH